MLLTTLEAYAKELRTHLAGLRERHRNLQLAWVRLREVYEGEAARAFTEAFEIASKTLTDYADQTHGALEQLEAKIEQLRKTDVSPS
jgi:uncharacterized protein YukE